jgi:preprotein translocase subunit SecG
MYQLIIIVHVLLGLGVVGLVLIQQGKGADAGAAFAGGSGSVFGAQGASSFLSRTTAILAALFFTTSLGLAVLSGHQNKTDDLIMDQPAIEQPLEDVPLIGNETANPEIFSNQAPISSVPVIDDSLEAVNKTAEILNTPSQLNNITPDATEESVEQSTNIPTQP